ncbi:MAG: glutamate racemase, partial [Hydrogenobacter sp.]
DTLILGCTHYPLLSPAIKRYMGEVHIVDSANALNEEIASYVKNEGNASLSLFFTDQSPSLKNLIELILGEGQEHQLIPMLCSL